VETAVVEQTADPRNILPLREAGSTRLVQGQAALRTTSASASVPDRQAGRFGQQRSAVLRYHFCVSRYRGDQAVIGRTIRVRRQRVAIVGVLPREFHSSGVDRAGVRVSMASAPALLSTARKACPAGG